MDIALRKNFKEVQEIIAAIPVKDPPQVKRSKHKSESLPSQGSRQSREKKHKTKSSKEHQKIPYHSPYGCPMLPDAKEFPQPRINSLPTEPLRKGEQYYIDLAGNIRKGPVGKLYNCYCVPLIEKVEKKLLKEKKELKEEIENCRSNLNNKISSLERKTNFQMVSLNETVKSRLSTERLQCIERNQRSNLKQRLDYERNQLQQAEQLKNQMKCWLESRLNQPTPSPRKYQPNPARHRNNNYHDGLTCQRVEQSNNRNVDYQPTTATENGNTLNDAYDRPKSCLSYNKDFVSTLTTCYNNGVRSKSETHLAIAPGETIGTFDTQPGCSGHTRINGVCIGTTQAEVYYDGVHSCSEDSDEEVITSHNNSSNINDISNQTVAKTNCDTPNNNIKDIYDLPANGRRKITAETVISQPVQATSATSNNTNVKSKPPQPLPASQSTSSHCPPEDDHSGDLMKSLRCNVVPRGETDYRNSPFSDSGFRSKYSPSPREGPLTDVTLVYPEPKLTRELYPTQNDSAMGLQPPSIKQLNERPPFRREPIPTRLNMATPASSLV
uniref:Uncharacterized protein n=2 Tax=Tetranychus urticae TaxID=32264 RepID=T1KHB9_TETUR